MSRLNLFFVLLAVTTVYALWRGDRDNRIAALICLAAVALTQLLLAPVYQRYTAIEAGVFLVDLAVLLGFTAIALFSDRFWPLWVAGLQLTTVVGHVFKMIDRALLPLVYGVALNFWSYPILMIVLAGAWRASRRRLAQDRGVATLA